jgi:hypothetical protein
MWNRDPKTDRQTSDKGVIREFKEDVVRSRNISAGAGMYWTMSQFRKGVEGTTGLVLGKYYFCRASAAHPKNIPAHLNIQIEL